MKTATLFDFGTTPTPTTKTYARSTKLVVRPREKNPDPKQEHSVLLDATTPIIRNFALVRQMVKEAFQVEEPKKVHLLLLSNGSEDRPATLWQLRRILS